MAAEHELIMREGLETALSTATGSRERANLRLAAEILAQEIERPGATTHLHSILCTTYLPHRRTAPDEIWQRSNGEGATLMIQPTRDEQGRSYGVPYGATGRLMMIYLQNEAYRNRSREVELGRSMHAWLCAMGVDSGGKGYKAAREQALRIERSLITVLYLSARGRERWQDTIIRGSFHLDEGQQPDLFPQAIQLSETFYAALLRHPAVLFEPAIRHLSGKSLALDVYLWLAYRLHALEREVAVGWAALHDAFGPNYGRERDFRAKFKDALTDALLVYPQARVEPEERGLRLLPSAPPGPPRSTARLATRPAPAAEVPHLRLL
ncbi:MAG TPA: replication protein RepA [Geminicoccaceae bacterium]|nr:replication protein RepA [Geminicoccaceae bacterium]